MKRSPSTTAFQHLPILLRWAVFAMLILVLVPQGAASAHPVDMYAQEQAITLTADGIQIVWKITPGPLLADSVWAAADADHNGTISPPEAQAWAAPFLAALSATINGQPLALRVDSLHWPAAIDVFRTGEESIQMQLSAQWPAKADEERHVQIHNAHLEANSLNWFSLNGLSFSIPQQNNGRLNFDLIESTLTSWNSGQPDLASQMAQNLTNAAPGGSGATAALVGLVKVTELSPLFLLTALLLSLALGSLHALTPGHGKTLVAAYLIGSRGRSRDAVFLGLVVTLTHTGSVILLGALTLLASQYILPGLIAPWLEIVSGMLVIIFGFNLFYQRRQVLTDWWAARHIKKPRFSLQSATVIQPAARFGLRSTSSMEHAHIHGPGGHTHLPTGEITWKSLLALGISGGLVPCPDAIAILLVAVAINRILFGMALIVAFSVGLALVLILIGIAMVQGVRLVARSDMLTRFSRYTPLVSAVVVAGLGVGLTVNAVNALKFTSAATQPGQAPSLLYLLLDSEGKLQLTRQPLTGGTAISYTREPDGLAGYALSPDHASILYLVFDANAQTTMHIIRSDGTDARLVLDCKQAQCGAPVWHPDGRRVIYQRAEAAGESGLSRFSLWWLDVTSGETRPVFQDAGFASYAAAFSSDGQWLSYKSPGNNTLQIYNLEDGRAISIPIPALSGPTQSWSPVGDVLLFWDAGLRVTRYDLKSGRKIDLGGAPGQADYAAVWSPDGAWVAIDREPPVAAQRKRGDQVWLMRPDGTDARLLLDEADASYSDIVWSADGKALFYTRYSYLNVGKSEIWRFDVATGAKEQIAASGMEPALLP